MLSWNHYPVRPGLCHPQQQASRNESHPGLAVIVPCYENREALPPGIRRECSKCRGLMLASECQHPAETCSSSPRHFPSPCDYSSNMKCFLYFFFFSFLRLNFRNWSNPHIHFKNQQLSPKHYKMHTTRCDSSPCWNPHQDTG